MGKTPVVLEIFQQDGTSETSGARFVSKRAIARTTSALLGLYSLVTLLAHEPMTKCAVPLPQAAWYSKTTPTFSDALAWVRRQLWTQATFPLNWPWRW
jgi:hypothetical protein